MQALCLDFWQWQASIPHPAGRGHVAQRGDPLGEENMILAILRGS